MICPTCGKEQLTERPHRHPDGYSEPPEPDGDGYVRNEADIAKLADVLHLQGVGCCEHPDDGPVLHAATHRDQANGILAHVNLWRPVSGYSEPGERDREALRERLVRDFASAFIRIRGAHNPKGSPDEDPDLIGWGEPCPWCLLAAEQAAEAVVTTPIAAYLRGAQPKEPQSEPSETHLLPGDVELQRLGIPTFEEVQEMPHD